MAGVSSRHLLPGAERCHNLLKEEVAGVLSLNKELWKLVSHSLQQDLTSPAFRLTRLCLGVTLVTVSETFWGPGHSFPLPSNFLPRCGVSLWRLVWPLGGLLSKLLPSAHVKIVRVLHTMIEPRHELSQTDFAPNSFFGGSDL